MSLDEGENQVRLLDYRNSLPRPIPGGLPSAIEAAAPDLQDQGDIRPLFLNDDLELLGGNNSIDNENTIEDTGDEVRVTDDN